MLRYRAATRFQTAYCPEITCGLAVKEDIEDAHYTEITNTNTEQLSADEKLAQAQQQEEQANSQSLDMNNGEKKEENKAADNQPTDTQKAADTAENAAQTKRKAQPMGKQEMPDMFKQQ